MTAPNQNLSRLQGKGEAIVMLIHHLQLFPPSAAKILSGRSRDKAVGMSANDHQFAIDKQRGMTSPCSIHVRQPLCWDPNHRTTVPLIFGQILLLLLRPDGGRSKQTTKD
jgi:hypothetical protein